MAYWTDKAALVTGGSAGLGLAIARALVEAGAKVTIAARDQSRLSAAAQSLQAGGQPCDSIGAVVTRQADCERMVSQTLAARGRLDLLVNCAGRSARGEVAATTAEQFAE